MELSTLTFSVMKERLAGKMSAKRLCEMAKAAELKTVDMLDTELTIYGKETMKKALAQAGVCCECLIGAPPFFSDGEKVEGTVLRLLELAKEMGASLLMLVPGHGTETENIACQGMTKEQKQDILVKYYTMAVEMAKGYHIGICMENTPQVSKPLSSAEDCLYLLSHVEGLNFVFDTANMKVADVKADEIAFYQALKSYIRRVHIKDVVIGSFKDGEACHNGEKMVAVEPCSGVIKIRELLHLLAEDGFAGKLVLEYASTPDISGKEHIDHIRNQCAHLREILNGREILPPYTSMEGIDKPVPRLFFGTAIMPMLRGKNVNGLLDGIYACGINAFDCARGYGGAEKSLGMWMKARQNRERIILLTKCGNVSPTGKVCVDREVIEKELETSLKMLETDYIDIYLLHRDDPNTPVGEIIECLNQAQRQGKIRMFGASNWTHQRIAQANAYAVSHGLNGFAISSPNFGLADQIADPWGGECITISGPSNAQAREWYAEQNMPVLAYSSLGRGFFSGRFKSGDVSGAKEMLDGPAQKGYLCDANMERLRRAEVLAQEKGYSVAQIAIAYIFNQAMPVSAIVSTTNPSRMRQNILAAQIQLTDQEVTWLENIDEDT